jgi:ABC-2 type transport system permease protein
MAFIYGSLLGVTIVLSLEGNQSPLGARRNISPTHKLKILCADTIGSIIIHTASIFILLAYLIFVLKIDFGSNVGYVMLASAQGCIIGVCMGVFLGAIVKGGEAIKTSFAIAVSMAFSFMSGLMVNNMPHIVEENCPILNRINPCTLLSNCFYSLNVYGDFTEFWKNFIGMIIISVVFIFGAFLLLRRRKYASI